MNRTPKSKDGLPRNPFRTVKNPRWMERELKRLVELRPVSFGDARIALEARIAHATERVRQIDTATCNSTP